VLTYKIGAEGLASCFDFSFFIFQIPEHCLDTLKHIHREPDPKTQLDVRVPQDDDERTLLGTCVAYFLFFTALFDPRYPVSGSSENCIFIIF